MALYMPAGRTRRRTALIAVAAALLALVLGFAIGRVSAPTVDDRITSTASDAQDLTGRLNSLTIEYEKVLANDPQYADGQFDKTLAAIVVDTQRLADDTPWLGSTERSAVVQPVEAVRAAAAATVPASEFADRVHDAVDEMNQTFNPR